MFGTRLKEARIAAGMSQADVAKAVGVSQPAYFYMENGDKMPSLPVAKQLSKILKVSLDYLVGNDEQPTDAR